MSEETNKPTEHKDLTPDKDATGGRGGHNKPDTGGHTKGQ